MWEGPSHHFLMVASHHKLLETREGGGIGRTYQTVAGCAGLRRHSLTELYTAPAGAYMPLERHTYA